MRARASVVIAFGLSLATTAALWRRALSGDGAPGPELVRGGPAVLYGVGIALAAAAYLVGYLKDARTHPEPLGLRHLLLAVAIHACSAPAPPFTSTDARMALAYGRLAYLDLNPYTRPPTTLPETDPYRAGLDWPGKVCAWGPPTVWLSALAARAADRGTALVIYKAAMLAVVLLAVGVAYLYCRRLPVVEAGAAFFFFACNPLLAWELSGQAHNDALLVLAATAFVGAAQARKRVAAASLLCFGTVTKYGLGAALGLYWLLLWRESRVRGAQATLLSALIVSLLWAPFFEGASAFRGLWTAAVPRLEWVVNSPASFLRVLGSLNPQLFWIWSAATAVLMLAVAARYAARARSVATVFSDAFSFTLLFQIFAMSSYWPWYATWLIPLALGREMGEQRLTAVAFTAFAPGLYFTGAAGAVAIVVVHGLALTLWLAPQLASGYRA